MLGMVKIGREQAREDSPAQSLDIREIFVHENGRYVLDISLTLAPRCCYASATILCYTLPNQCVM